MLLSNRNKIKQENKLRFEVLKRQEKAAKDVIQAEENERQRIASELQDSLGQLFSAVKMNLSGLTSAIRDFISKIDARKLKINLETFGLQERLDQNTEAVLYRVIQESVNNVIKHARATSLDIQLSKDEEGVNVMIGDNGVGFSIEMKDFYTGMGLKNISSRVNYLKGNVDISFDSGKGTLVAIHIPL